MKVIIDLEPSSPDADVLEALKTLLRQVADDKLADPDLDCYLELADFTGRALRAEVVGVIPEVTSGHIYRLAVWKPVGEL